MSRPIGYLTRHWQGRLSLSVSFWLNFVGVGITLYFLQRWLASALGDDIELSFFATLGGFVLFRLVIFPWQAVGVLRASEHALAEMPSPVWPRAAQGAVVLGVLVVLVDALGVFHAFYAIRAEQDRIAATPPLSEPDYRLDVSDNGRRLQLAGTLDPGVTRATRQLLAGLETVTVVELESTGGRVYEARGLAKLFQERGLDTHVETECSSACATAFMGGSTRTLASGGRLGFHGYRLQAWNVRPDMTPRSEQEIDMAYYASRGVDVTRLGSAFKVGAAGMWYPGHEVLLAAGIAHRIVQSGTLTPE